MAEREVVDFDISIEVVDDANRQYRVRVLDAPAGTGSHIFTFPFEKLERENYILRLGPARRGRRRLETIELQLAKEFGNRLFEAVFGGEILSCWRSSLDLTARNQQGLRLKLRLSDAPDLVNLPWEYLYSRSSNSFPALSVDTPIVRYLDLSGWTPPLSVKPPLKALVMISSPTDVATLNTEGEWQRIQKAFSSLTQTGLVHVDRVEPTLPALLHALDQDDYHIFHFIGHGAYDAGVNDGILVLEDEKRSGKVVSGQRLGALLRDENSIRLVVLNACDGGRSSDDDPFTGVAQSLLQQGIPAVVAMQFEISDEAALVFAEEFYASLAAGHPVDIALARTRKGMYAIGDSAEWGTPVLYLRTNEGQLFDIDQSVVPTPPSVVVPTQTLPPVAVSIDDEDTAQRPPVSVIPKNVLTLAAILALLVVLFVVGSMFWPLGESEASPRNILSILGLSFAPATSTPTTIPTATSTSPPAASALIPASATPSPEAPLNLVYVRGNVSNTDIWVMEFESSATYPIATERCDEAEPAWFPTGRAVIYQANCDGSYELYRVDLADGRKTRLTMTAQIDEQEPDVSHDGRYIAFRVSGVGDDRNSDGDIWIMQADGQDLQRLGIRGRSPVWSPDDTTLAFMSERSGNWDIYTYNLSSGQERQITQCTVNCRWPAWSPDGGAVLYHTTTGRNSVSADALWYAPVTGGNPIPITSGFGSGRGSWSSEALIVFNSDNGVEYARVDGGSRTVLIAGGENWAPIWSR